MKIVGFESGTGPHLGVVEGDQVIDRARGLRNPIVDEPARRACGGGQFAIAPRASYPMSAVAVAVTRGFPANEVQDG